MLKKQSGLAMLLVLMITAVIAIVVTIYQYKNKAMLSLASQAKDHMLARAALESTKEELLFNLSTTRLWLQGPTGELNGQLNMPLALNFRGQEFDWNGVNITITDTSGLISTIPFNRVAWLNLFRYHQLPNPDYALAALEDWFDKDEFVRLNGAERLDYKQAGRPRNDLPQSLSELAQVQNLGPYWSKLAPYITFLGHDVVSYQFSPDKLLPVLLGEYRAQQMLESRHGSKENNSSDDAGLMIEKSEDMSVFPSLRLRISLSVEQGDAAYRESFVLLRARYNKRLSFIAEKQPGFTLLESVQSEVN